MKDLVIDIETIYDVTMEPFLPEKKEKDKKNPREKVQFDSNFNEICCISAYDGENAKHFGLSEFEFNENKMLEEFWKYVQNFDRFITFNGNSFDIPFLYKRSFINRVVPSVFISTKKYYLENHIDIRMILANWDNYANGSLDLYCKIMLKRSDKEDIDGSKVQLFWDSKKYEEIYKYCEQDCINTWELYQLMKNYYQGV